MVGRWTNTEYATNTVIKTTETTKARIRRANSETRHVGRGGIDNTIMAMNKSKNGSKPKSFEEV